MLTRHRLTSSRLARERGTFVSVVLAASAATALTGSFAIGALLPLTVEAGSATRAAGLAAAHGTASPDNVRVYTKPAPFAVICRHRGATLLVRDTRGGWHVERRAAAAARTLRASCQD